VVGGTSAAAPLWAAMIAMVNDLGSCRGFPIGFANPYLYSVAGANYGANFNSANNADPNNLGAPNNDANGLNFGKYPIAPEYDMATGLGTPIGSTLGSSLCAQRSPVFAVLVNNPGGQLSLTGHFVAVQISGSDSGGQALKFTAAGLPAGLSMSASGLITGIPLFAGSGVVTVNATDQYNNSGGTQFAWTVITPGPPTVAHKRLTGEFRNRARFKLTLDEGTNAPPIASVTIKLPRALSFVLKLKLLKKGVTVKGPGGSRIAWNANVHAGRITFTFSHPPSQVRITLAWPAVIVRHGLKSTTEVVIHHRRHRKHNKLTFTVIVKDAGGASTQLPLTFTL
jgi:hypothetical protein